MPIEWMRRTITTDDDDMFEIVGFASTPKQPDTFALIRAIVEDYGDGTYATALKMADFLEAEAGKIRESVSDDMSARHD